MNVIDFVGHLNFEGLDAVVVKRCTLIGKDLLMLDLRENNSDYPDGTVRYLAVALQAGAGTWRTTWTTGTKMSGQAFKGEFEVYSMMWIDIFQMTGDELVLEGTWFQGESEDEKWGFKARLNRAQ